MAPPLRILCVDDHPMVLEGITSVINNEPDMEVVATAGSGEEAVELFRKHDPDVTLMDLQLSSMSGVEAIRAIRSEYPQARILVLTMLHGDEDVFQALEAGAASYLLKNVRSDELLRVMRQVYAGAHSLPSDIAGLLAARRKQPFLTHRELEVMEHIARGLRNKEIGDRLGVSEETAKVHVRNILRKLDVTDRSAAINVAIRRGIIHLQ